MFFLQHLFTVFTSVLLYFLQHSSSAAELSTSISTRRLDGEGLPQVISLVLVAKSCSQAQGILAKARSLLLITITDRTLSPSVV